MPGLTTVNYLLNQPSVNELETMLPTDSANLSITDRVINAASQAINPPASESSSVALATVACKPKKKVTFAPLPHDQLIYAREMPKPDFLYKAEKHGLRWKPYNSNPTTLSNFVTITVKLDDNTTHPLFHISKRFYDYSLHPNAQSSNQSEPCSQKEPCNQSDKLKIYIKYVLYIKRYVHYAGRWMKESQALADIQKTDEDNCMQTTNPT